MFAIDWSNLKVRLAVISVAAALAAPVAAGAQDETTGASLGESQGKTKKAKKKKGAKNRGTKSKTTADETATTSENKTSDDVALEGESSASLPDEAGETEKTESEKSEAEADAAETGSDAAEADDDASKASGDAAEAEDDAAEADAEGGEEDSEEADVEVVESSDTSKSRGIFPSEFDGEAALRRDRGINILTARAVRPMSLLLVIDHRAYKNLFSGKDAFYDYLGLDHSGLKVGFGLRFGIIEGLDAGLYRLNDGGTVEFDTYEFDVRYAFLRQEKFQVDVSARAGLTWFSQPEVDDSVGGYGQIFVDRVFLDMLLVGAGFQIHSDSTNDSKSDADTPYSGAIQGVVEWRFLRMLAADFEVSYAVAGYKSKYPDLTFALKVITHRHTFSFMITNTQFISADGIVSNTDRDFENLIFGFQIMREFNFGNRGK